MSVRQRRTEAFQLIGAVNRLLYDLKNKVFAAKRDRLISPDVYADLETIKEYQARLLEFADLDNRVRKNIDIALSRFYTFETEIQDLEAHLASPHDELMNNDMDMDMDIGIDDNQDELMNNNNQIIGRRRRVGEEYNLNKRQPNIFSNRINSLQRKINDLLENIDRIQEMILNNSPRNQGFTYAMQYQNSMIFDPDDVNENIASDLADRLIGMFKELTQMVYQFSGGLGDYYENNSILPTNNKINKKLKTLAILKRLIMAHFALYKRDFVYDFRRFQRDDPKKYQYHREFIIRLFTLLSAIPINLAKQSFYVLQVNYMNGGENINRIWYIHPHSSSHLLKGLLDVIRNLRTIDISDNQVGAPSDPVTVLRDIRNLRFIRFMPMGLFITGETRNTQNKLDRGELIPESLLSNWEFVIDSKLHNLRSLDDQMSSLTPFYIDNVLIPEVRRYIRNDQENLILEAGVKNFTENEQKQMRDFHIGGFFPYYHKTDLDLTRYQIPKNRNDFIKHKNIYDRSCLLYALEMSGQFSESEIEDISQICYGRVIPIRKLVEACANYNFAINLKKFYKDNSHPSRCYFIGNKENSTRIINIGLIESHFFIIDKQIQVTGYYLNHYDEIHEMLNIKRPDLLNSEQKWRISSLADARGEIRYAPINSRKIADSFKLIKILCETKKIEPISLGDVISLDMVLYRDINVGKHREYLGSLEYNDKQCLQSFWLHNKRTVPKPVSRSARTIVGNKTGNVLVFYADFESFTVDNDGHPLEKHIPFMCCVSHEHTDFVNTFHGDRCGEMLLYFITSVIRNNPEYKNWSPLVYFHNLGYDINFLAKYGIINSMQRGRKMLSTEILFNGMIITFKDSASLLPMKLSSFGSVFGLKVHKELFPYKYYTPERYYEHDYNKGDFNECLRIMGWEKGEKYYQFLSNIREVEGLDEEEDVEEFNMSDYAEFYCQKDVEVLKAGVEMFSKSIKEDFGIEARDYLSISSIADAIFNKEVYSHIKDLYLVGGIVREFLSYAVHGGRVMPSENKKWAYKLTSEEIRAGDGLCDFDAVSLYPSAMARLWLVDGKPKVFNSEQLEDNKFVKDNHYSAYVVEILITKVGIPRQFPLVIGKNPDTGSVLNTNTPPVIMTVCDIELEDLIEFQQIEFRTLRGYYWTGEKHLEIQDCIKKIFTKRAEYKKQGNPIQNVYKLIMNSIYGKTILKPHTSKITYIKQSDPKLKNLINYHASEIQYINQIDESDILAIKRTKPIGLHFNFSLFGIHILAMSKRIMNEVMCLAEDLGMRIYYQDTDSMHIEKYNLETLASKFKYKYGRELIGTNLGQFHSDFDLKPESTNVRSVEAYFIGKKCYVDKLIDDQGNEGYHIRLKGVPTASVIDLANRDYHGNVLEVYKQLAIGNSLKFNLLAGEAVKFDFTRSMTIKNKEEFNRIIGFNRTLPPDNYENGAFIYKNSFDGELYEERVKRK